MRVARRPWAPMRESSPPHAAQETRVARAKEWVRHHTNAFLSSCVDFLAMIACVEALHLHPVQATVAGAFLGALTNFLLGRTWVFHRRDAKATAQVLRYAVVALASLGLNALGEYLLVARGLGYVLSRILVAVTVSNLWNYPLHKYFVFARPKPSR